MSRVASWLRLGGAEPGEEARVGWSFALFFSVFSSWYVLRPVRDAMGIVGDTKDLPRLFLVTLVATLAMTPFVSAMVSRLPRRRFLAIAYRFLAATLVVFFVLLRGAAPTPLAARAFFVWASVFNLFEVALAWGFMADVFSRGQGIRLFALVGAGGTLGAMTGSLLAATLVPRVGVASTLLVAAVLLEAAVRCVGRLDDAAPGGTAVATPPSVGPRKLRWLVRAVTSPYFLGICGYMTLFTLTSTVLYLEQARIVRASLTDLTTRTALFARMDLAVNATTLMLQLLVVGRAVRHMGVGIALAVLPAATLACFVSLRLAPVLAVLVVCQVARRVLDYALTRPTREVLFTTVRHDDKYRAKSFIDTFVYRGGDVLGAVGFEGFGGPKMLAAMAMVCVGWGALGVMLGKPERWRSK